jgi:hypothetical protein
MGRLEEYIKRFSRIAIDTNSFIYLMERHPKYFKPDSERSTKWLVIWTKS